MKTIENNENIHFYTISFRSIYYTVNKLYITIAENIKEIKYNLKVSQLLLIFILRKGHFFLKKLQFYGKSNASF